MDRSLSCDAVHHVDPYSRSAILLGKGAVLLRLPERRNPQIVSLGFERLATG